jgi:hypothetical protein
VRQTAVPSTHLCARSGGGRLYAPTDVAGYDWSVRRLGSFRGFVSRVQRTWPECAPVSQESPRRLKGKVQWLADWHAPAPGPIPALVAVPVPCPSPGRAGDKHTCRADSGGVESRFGAATRSLVGSVGDGKERTEGRGWRAHPLTVSVAAATHPRGIGARCWGCGYDRRRAQAASLEHRPVRSKAS